MKRRTIRFALAVFAAGGLLASSCVRAPAPEVRPALSSVNAGWVSRTLKRMTLEEKIGQMVFPRYPGVFVNRDSDSLRGLETLIRESHIGGLLVAAGEAYETAYLLNHLQRTARIPLLVASDLERGAGNQIGGATLFPPLMGFGAAGSEELAESLGRITAREGRALGIHLTCAPVADVNINPGQSHHQRPVRRRGSRLVGRIAAAFIRGCQSNGMIAAVKHFPGHGDTAQDSHSLVPIVGGDRQRLEAVELPPFRRAVEAGVRAVMTAHLAVPAVDPAPGIPATFSPAVVTELLRDEPGLPRARPDGRPEHGRGREILLFGKSRGARGPGRSGHPAPAARPGRSRPASGRRRPIREGPALQDRGVGPENPRSQSVAGARPEPARRSRASLPFDRPQGVPGGSRKSLRAIRHAGPERRRDRCLFPAKDGRSRLYR